MSLHSDLLKIANKNNQRMETLVRASLIQVANQCVTRSPVGNPDLWKWPNIPIGYVGGSFRANWRFGDDAINTTTSIDDTSIGSSMAEVGKIMTITIGKTVYFTNSLPYAQRLEYDGHSRQAKKGIVRPSVQSFKAAVHAQAKAIT